MPNKIHRWILNLTAETWVTIGDIRCGAEHLGGLLNMRIPPYELETVLACVRELGDRGLIAVTEKDVSELDDAQLGPDPNRPPRFARYLHLTTRGTRFWESVARPRWDRLVEVSGGSGDSLIHVECLTRELMEEVIRGLSTIGYQVNFAEGRVSERRPWQPIDWKSFESGWEFEAPLIETGGEAYGPLRPIPWWFEPRAWYTELWDLDSPW
jgi:hypothetical protein